MEIVVLLLLTMAIPFPLCYFRMKEYDISLPKMLLIYLVFSTVGFIGAWFGPALVGIEDSGIRLYGLVLFDLMALFVMSMVLRIDMRILGDFVAPPIMAVCACSKINCMIHNCCRGIVMWHNGEQSILFPSAIVELIIWAVFVVALLMVERKKTADGFMWPQLMIWFGITRCLVDFLRGSVWERRPYFMFLSGGQFWSLVAAVAGVLLMIYTFHKNWKRFPTMAEAFFIALGGKTGKSV